MVKSLNTASDAVSGIAMLQDLAKSLRRRQYGLTVLMSAGACAMLRVRVLRVRSQPPTP